MLILIVLGYFFPLYLLGRGAAQSHIIGEITQKNLSGSV